MSDYLVRATPAPEDAPAQKIARLRSALEVLSAQTGIPLRRARPEGAIAHG